MVDRFEGELVREEPNQVTSALRYAWFAASIALIPVLYLRLLPEAVLAGVGLGWFVVSFATIPIMSLFAKRPKRSVVTLRVDEDGLHVDGARIVQRRNLRAGAMHATKDGAHRVVFQCRRGLAAAFGRSPTLAFYTREPGQAHAMLAAAGVDAGRQVFRATFLRPQAAWQLVLPALTYVALSAAFFELSWHVFGTSGDFAESPVVGVAPVLLAGALAFAVYALLARTTVSVGNDGIEIRRAFRRRFLGLDQIRDVEIEPKALRILLAHGESIPLARAAPIEPVGHFGASDIGMERALLGDRILEVVRAHALRRSHGAAVVALGRDSRSADAWLAALRAVGSGASDYRTGAVPVEELERLVSDATTARDVRIGAAVALRVAVGDGAIERIRVAAEATAAPELREVLAELAGEADEDQLRQRIARMR